jgi:hypothetical protein
MAAATAVTAPAAEVLLLTGGAYRGERKEENPYLRGLGP